MLRALITTVPFGQIDPLPLEQLAAAGFTASMNPLGRRLTEPELVALMADARPDVLIAGTEPISAPAMDAAPSLRLISRVGVGLDSVDLLAARERKIPVSFTPDAPAPAVAELAIGLMLTLLRDIHLANQTAHCGEWRRRLGRRLSELTVGVIGTGRIGSRVVRHLSGFAPRILANDLQPRTLDGAVEWVEKEQIYRDADIVTLHVPLTPLTRRLIGRRELESFKSQGLLINTARGGIVDEAALASALRDERLAGAALDVFEVEPYQGELAALDRCVMTCHMGSMTQDCRCRMEIEAVENACRFIAGAPGVQYVPEDEYASRTAAAHVEGT